MAKPKWPKLPGYTIPLFESANVYLATTREEFIQADKFCGGNIGERPFNAGLASAYENEEGGERIYLIGVFDKQLRRSFTNAPTYVFMFAPTLV